VDEKTLSLLSLLEEDGKRLHVLLVRLTLREDVADDLMQELFLKLQRTEAWLGASNKRAYAERAAIHLAFDWRRRQRRRRDIEQLKSDPAARASSPVDTLADREEIEQILVGLADIPETARDCILLRYLQQQEYDAIGEQVGKTPHQVRAICCKAIKRLRKLLHATTRQ
jgi:RNA polymerase sigma factor (sigma-70 family)